MFKCLAAISGFVLCAQCAAQVSLPGTIKAASYSNMLNVGTEWTSDVGGGLDVGWIGAGSWLSYSVNPVSSGWYTVQYRVASPNSTGQLVLSENAVDISEAVSIPNTGGWQSWSTVTSRVYLNAGSQNLAVYARTGGFNLNWINITTAPLPAIHQSGQFWVDPNGKRVNLRGVNVGNWLIQEFWMMGSGIANSAGTVPDQCTLESTLSSRFGAGEKERLMGVFRDSWITGRDFDLMKSMGMNVVRVPFLYSLVEDEYHPYTLRPDAWKYLDYAVNEAEKRGMYVILDLHGTVGGQAAASEQHDGCTGPAQLWTNPTYQDRTKWLWDMIATHYNGRSAIAAYDLLNEPWGTDATTLANFAYQLFDVVRAKDPNHIILLPGHITAGISAYGNPNSRGLKNAAFWMHFYPGFWGWNEVVGPVNQANMHANWLHCNASFTGETCDWNNRIAGLSSPFLVGEMQPWTLLGQYGGQVTRKTYDIYNEYGWAATSWAYKTVTLPGSNGNTSSWGWGMITNSSNGGAMGNLNISSDSNATIENYFRSFATQPLVRNEDIAYWMKWQPTVGQRIEAEMFNTHSGVRMETTTDTGGGFNVSNIGNNSWMSYSINVPKSGWYNLQFRVASPNRDGQLVLSQNAADLVSIVVPNTGGWQNWQTVYSSVYLTAGQQDLAIFSRVGGWNINWWQLTAQ